MNKTSINTRWGPIRYDSLGQLYENKEHSYILIVFKHNYPLTYFHLLNNPVGQVFLIPAVIGYRSPPAQDLL